MLTAEVVRAFEHRSANGVLSSQQIKAAFGDCGLDFSCFGEPDNPMYKFYNDFKEDRSYSVKKLSLLAILISKGEAKDKARLLFDAYDEDGNKELAPEELRKAFEGAADVAIGILIDLGVGEHYDGMMEQSRLDTYKSKCEEMRDEKLEQIIKDVYGDAPKLEVGAFMSKMAVKHFKNLLTADGLRSYIHGPVVAEGAASQ